MSRRRYYTLCERAPGQMWTPEFGDYNKQVVIQERRDRKESGSFIKGTEFKIIEAGVSQKAINEAVELLNAAAIAAKGFTQADLDRHAKHNAKVASDARRRYGSGPD